MITNLIWNLVEQMEERRNTTIHYVILAGKHIELTLSRHDILSEHVSMSNTDPYTKLFTLHYSDDNIQDILYVYVAEEADNEISPIAILHLEQYDESLNLLTHQIESLMQNSPAFFQHHSDIVKEQFMSQMDKLYDRYVPETYTVQFIGYFSIDGERIPLGRMNEDDIITISSSEVSLHLDEAYPAICINGEYHVKNEVRK